MIQARNMVLNVARDSSSSVRHDMHLLMIDNSENKKSLFCDNNRYHNNTYKCNKHQSNYHLHLTISTPHLSLYLSST
jgi:hypothetical protein